jgi:uncharacterized OB-fold protein
MTSDEGWIHPNEETQPFFDGANEGVLRLQRCNKCDTWMYPFKRRCQHCGSSDLTWQDASGTGTIYTHAKLHRQHHPRHEGKLPVVIAWIDLDEGVRMPSNLVASDSGEPRAGKSVRVTFETDPGGNAFPVFELV